MLKIIGNENCSRCEMTKHILTQKGIEFEYILLFDLSDQEQEYYLSMALEAGQRTLPVIIENNTVIKLEDIKIEDIEEKH